MGYPPPPSPRTISEVDRDDANRHGLIQFLGKSGRCARAPIDELRLPADMDAGIRRATDTTDSHEAQHHTENESLDHLDAPWIVRELRFAASYAAYSPLLILYHHSYIFVNT